MLEQSGEQVGEGAPTTPGYTPTTPGFSPTSPVADVCEDEPHGEDRVSGDVVKIESLCEDEPHGEVPAAAPTVPSEAGATSSPTPADAAGPASLSSRFHGGDVAAGES